MLHRLHRYRHFTGAAMLEQICRVEGTPREFYDGWWRVGVFMDSTADVELDAEFYPGERKIRLREPAPRPEKEPPKPAEPKPRQTYLPDEERRFRAWMEGGQSNHVVKRS
jgi:hypothetical protein